uniref:Uncharacterized protein n=1 Tax=Arundo donax TaxID=35708 RepID=A0A0A9FJF1_ARUDO
MKFFLYHALLIIKLLYYHGNLCHYFVGCFLSRGTNWASDLMMDQQYYLICKCK